MAKYHMRKHSASPVIKKMQTFKMRYTFKIYNVSKKKKSTLDNIRH